MAIATDEAIERLGEIADVFLTHNRPIVRPVDDSIVRIGADGVEVLRRARGYAPLSVGQVSSISHEEVPTVLALGGHLKNTVALLLGRVRACTHAEKLSAPQSVSIGVRASTHPTSAPVVMSAHIGDLDSVRSVEVFQRAAADLVAFFQAEPDAVVCDLHPDYASTRHAERLAAQWDVPLLRVQHHHAHVAACMAEHGLQGPVVGFAWDGIGYGPDGTVWGGETLYCEGITYRRAARLRTFALPGGDRAAREPRRSALGLLFEIFGRDAARYAAAWFAPAEIDTILSMLTSRTNSPRSSSLGRLFDAVAAICGLPATISFEGQAAMAFEYVADPQEQEAYEFAIAEDDKMLVADWAPAVRSALADRAAGVPVGCISARFHNGLAEMAAAVARIVAPSFELPVVLTGGCFQNALLAERVVSRLAAAGYRVYNHHQVPPGDGCIALGQAWLGRQMLAKYPSYSV